MTPTTLRRLKIAAANSIGKQHLFVGEFQFIPDNLPPQFLSFVFRKLLVYESSYWTKNSAVDTHLTQHSHCRTYLRAGSKFSKCSIGHQMDFLPRNCPFRAVVMERAPCKEKAGTKKAFCRDQTSLTGRRLTLISAGHNDTTWPSGQGDNLSLYFATLIDGCLPA